MTKKSETDQKRSRGQPTKYDPDIHPGEAISLSAQGKTIAQICSTWNISRETWYHWIKLYKDFSDAIKVARQKREDYFTKFGWGLATGQIQGNVTAWVWLSKNCIGWKDRVDIGEADDTEPEWTEDGNDSL